MKITGYTSRSLAERDEISYSVSLSFNNITGSGIFGFSGYYEDDAHHPEYLTPTRLHKYTFKEGKIYDPENRYFGSYEANSQVVISGNISGSKYDYHFNDNPIAFVGDIGTGMPMAYFCYDASGVEIDSELTVRSATFLHELIQPSSHYFCGDAITGTILSKVTGGAPYYSQGPTGHDFEIFSGQVTSPSFWTFYDHSSGFRTSGDFFLKHTGESSGKANETYTVAYTLFTNFGNITGNVITTSRNSDALLGSIFDVGTSSTQTTSFVDTGVFNSFNRGQHVLDYRVYENLVLFTGEKPVSVELKDVDTTSNVIGYKVTGVQLKGSQKNGLYTSLPTVTFSSTGAYDIQATATALTGAYKAFDLTTGGTLPASPLLDSNVTFFTVTGLSVDTPGSYEDATSISVNFSGGLYDSATGVFAYQENGDNSSYYYSGASYGNIIDSHIKQHASEAVALTNTGNVFSRTFEDTWNLVTGTPQTVTTGRQLHSLNSGLSGTWPNNFSANIYNSGLSNIFSSGDGLSSDKLSYHTSGNIEQRELIVETWNQPKHRPVDDASARIVKEEKYYTVNNNPSIDFASTTSPVFVNELKNLITGVVTTGGTTGIDFTYSFINTGSQNQQTWGYFKELKDDTNSVSVSDFTGEIGAAFTEWKGLLETTFSGLTVNFVNNGIETGSVNFYKNLCSNPYALPHTDDDKIGDIRIGLAGMTPANANNLTYNPVWASSCNMVVGESGLYAAGIIFNDSYSYRLDSDSSSNSTSYSIKNLMCREIGTKLGIDLSADKSSIMYNPQSGASAILTTDTFSTRFSSNLSGSLVDQDLLLKHYADSSTHDSFTENSTKSLSTNQNLYSANLTIKGSGNLNFTTLVTGGIG